MYVVIEVNMMIIILGFYNKGTCAESSDIVVYTL
jgi:hypothetical protein